MQRMSTVHWWCSHQAQPAAALHSPGSCTATPSLHSLIPAPNLAAAAKQAQHLDNVKREIKILTRLRGTLSVVHFKGAYEDDQNIHLVMELCRRVLGAVMLGPGGRLCEQGQYCRLACLHFTLATAWLCARAVLLAGAASWCTKLDGDPMMRRRCVGSGCLVNS